MKETLEIKLHNFLRAQGGRSIPYEQIKLLAEKVWLTSRGGHYRMEILTRRTRKDNLKENNISARIGKEYKNNAVVAFFYKTDSQMQPEIAPQQEQKPLRDTTLAFLKDFAPKEDKQQTLI